LSLKELQVRPTQGGQTFWIKQIKKADTRRTSILRKSTTKSYEKGSKIRRKESKKSDPRRTNVLNTGVEKAGEKSDTNRTNILRQ
jgi:hypothetical protein